MTLKFGWERRKAIYTAPVNRHSLGIVRGQEVPCRVWGCYQVEEEGDVAPYFVVELEDGRCTYVAPEHLRFIEMEDESDD